jgi:diaminopimelate epimerase
VHLDGGDLDIAWDESGGHIFKTGPAQTVFKGYLDI